VKARQLQLVAVAAATVGLLAASAPTSTAAGSSGTGSAYSAAGKAGTVSSITPTLKVCALSLLGILGSCNTGVLGAVNGLTGSLLTSTTAIVSDIQSIPNTVVDALVGTGLSASQPSVQLSRPSPQFNAGTGAPNMPTCGRQGWDASGTGDCYTGVGVTVPTSAVLGVNVSGVSGYATDDTSGYVGAAQAAGVTLSMLGGSLGNLNTVWASAQCANSTSSPNCQASNSTVTANLLPSAAYPSGALNLKVSGTSEQVLSLNGSALSGSNNKVTVPGVGTVTVALNSNLLTLTIALSSSQLTSLVPSLVGLSSLVSDSGTITIAIGPGSTSTSSGASASGLTISADLSLAIKLSTLGLATVDITAGSGISSPDLLNVSLAYASATAGTAAASWVPSGLI
jgi:hypothetical protein